MLNYNKSKNSFPIAYDTGNKQLVYYHKGEKNDSKIIASGDFEPFFPFKDQLIYIASRRGAGKSTFCNMYIKNYVDTQYFNLLNSKNLTTSMI